MDSVKTTERRWEHLQIIGSRWIYTYSLNIGSERLLWEKSVRFVVDYSSVRNLKKCAERQIINLFNGRGFIWAHWAKSFLLPLVISQSWSSVELDRLPCAA